MKLIHKTILLTATAISVCASANDPKLESVDFVNPYIDNISHLLMPTYPTIQMPNSMLKVYPERSDYTPELVNGLPIIMTNHREKSTFNLTSFFSGREQPLLQRVRRHCPRGQRPPVLYRRLDLGQALGEPRESDGRWQSGTRDGFRAKNFLRCRFFLRHLFIELKKY